MDASELFQSAFRSIVANKLRSALTALGLVVGVSAIITTITLLKGFEASIFSSMESFGSNLVEVRPVRPWELSSEEYNKVKFKDITLDDMQALFKELPHILIDICPILRPGRDEVFYRGRSTLANPLFSDETWLDTNKFELTQGRNLVPADLRLKSKVVIIGSLLIKNLGISGNPIGQSILYRNVSLEIIGVFGDLGSNVLFDMNDTMMIPITTGLVIHSDQKGQLTFSAHYLPTLEANYVEDVVVDAFRRIRGLKSNEIADFSVFTMAKAAKERKLVMAAITGVVASMLGISIIVGGIGIMNIMLVTVTERTREIGVRMAVGARRSHIVMQFLIEASLLCLFGGAVGLLLGYFIGAVVSKLLFNQTPWIPVSAFIVGFGVPAAIGLLFGYYPAATASKLDPIESLRHE